MKSNLRLLKKLQRLRRFFAQRAAPANFSCALQASFLNNVLREYTNACHRQQKPSPNASPYFIPVQQHSGAAQYPEADSGVSTEPMSTTSTSQTSMTRTPQISWSTPVECHGYSAYCNGSDLYNDNPTEPQVFQHENIVQTLKSCIDTTTETTTGESLEEAIIPDLSQNFFSCEEDLWSAMFINAGFNPQGGVFVPDNAL
jgi:hypothetical protein